MLGAVPVLHEARRPVTYQLGSRPDAWVRTWNSRRAGELVFEMAYDLGKREAARTGTASLASAALKKGHGYGAYRGSGAL